MGYERCFIQQEVYSAVHKTAGKNTKKFKERVALFKVDPHYPLLNTHRLHGKKRMFRSINITGDYRAQFLWEGDVVTFHEIGTHSELYG